MIDNKVAYLCDPEKNTSCSKTFCHYKGLGDCKHTTYPAFARNFECLPNKFGMFIEIEPDAKPQVSEAL